jgi:acyl transferase domain-containing protein/surfactin synthase thioesterase subunit
MTDDKILDSLKRLTLELRQARQSLRAAEEASREPIAIIAMSCRFPGRVSSPENLWRLVSDGIDAIGDFPADRGWDLTATGSYVREGGFLDRPADFDAALFGIGRREAMAMDPQQRLLLETAWEAFERARFDPTSVRGTPTGVFVGSNDRDYLFRLVGSEDYAESYADYAATGGAASVMSGRLSYFFGLEGPSITVDTACSSSLVTLHLACQALRERACTLALTGGISVMTTPGLFQTYGPQGALAPDGRCKAFAAAADGIGWAEGIGMLLVERLSDAQRNGHPVLAVVRGSAVNSDGASNGLTAPSGRAQRRVIRAALAAAGLKPGDVDALEAHGTGTALGDPIEAQVLLECYGQDREQPLLLGSVKSNIGHTQAASGVAGVIKMVLAMRHGHLPRTLHVDQPTPHVDWPEGDVALLTEQLPWPRTGRPRRCGISSFGVSGTNAHVILEEAPAPQAPAPGPADRYPRPGQEPVLTGGGYPWILSARSEPSLGAQATRLRSFLTENPQADPGEVGWSLASTRARLEHRAVILAGEREQATRALTALAEGATAPGLVRGHADADGKVAFVFPGQGAQWAGMAADLLDSSAVFRGRIMECEQALTPHVGWRLSEVLREAAGAPAWDRLDVLQPTLFAIMVSLAALWRSCGVEPSAVAGHSQGEIAAAVVAGALTLQDAAHIVAVRGHALAKLTGRGGMLSAALSPDDAERAISSLGGQVVIAAVNGPRSVILSGDAAALDELLAALTAKGVRARKVLAGYASHSAQVEAVRDRLLAELAFIQPRPGDIAFYSAVTGGPLDGGTLDAGYWYRNLRQPVRFDQVTRRLLESGHGMFVEVSPHPVLIPGIQETLDDLGHPEEAVVTGSLNRQQSGTASFLTSLAELHVRGLAVQWESIFAGHTRVIDLPTYAFAHKTYWAPVRQGTAGPPVDHQLAHPLLDTQTQLANGGDLVLSGRASLDTQPWLADHVVFGAVLFPGTAFLDLALHAARRAGAGELEELTMEAPLIVPDKGGVRLQARVGNPDSSGRRRVGIYAAADTSAGKWVRHADGMLSPSPPPAPALAWACSWPPEGAVEIGVTGLYEQLATAGLNYGAAFRGLRAAWRRGNEVFVEVARPENEHMAGFAVCPPLLDAALHGLALARDARDAGGQLPFAWNGVTAFAADAAELRVRLAAAPDYGFAVEAADATGSPVLLARSLALRPPSSPRQDAGPDPRHSLFRIEWTAISVDASARPARWAVLAGDRLPGMASGNAAGSGEVTYQGLASLRQAVASGTPLPDTVLFPVLSDGAASGGVASDGAGVGAATRAALHRALGVLQEWAAEELFGFSRLVILTSGAVATCAGEDVTDLPAAAVRGLARSAQSENPGRFVLIDCDPKASLASCLAAVPAGLSSGEPELAIRSGQVLGRRLARAEPAQAWRPTPAPKLERFGHPGGTVLIIGGTGTLGGMLARHLVTRRGVRSIVLASRRGPRADGSAALGGELASLGADVRVAACDAADYHALANLLAAIPRERPLTAVVHAGGVLDDGVLSSLNQERIDRVLRPKCEAAVNLHELLKDTPLAEFVLFSSASGTFGSPGQGNYAAANAFLDGLAENRRAHGMPGRSLAWGLWQQASGMTGHLAASERRRRTRDGAAPLSAKAGLALFDAACAMDDAVLVPVRLDPAVLRAGQNGKEAPPLWRGLSQAHERKAAMTKWSEPIRADAAYSEQDLLALVRTETARVLGADWAQEVSANLTFLEMGFDSLSAVKLRNRLSEITGLRLRSTIVFEFTTPRALAKHLHAGLSSVPHDGAPVASQPPAPIPAFTAVAEGPGFTPGSDGSLDSLLWRAARVGLGQETLNTLAPLARLRPAFNSVFDLGAIPEPARLCRGPAQPALVCVTSAVGKSDPSQYAQFAHAFRGKRDVWALSQAGFRRGELVPGSLQALVDAHTATIRRHIASSPFVLVGQSSGGMIANYLAGHLERTGLPVAAVVLIDTYPPENNDVLAKISGDFGQLLMERQMGPADGSVDQWGDAWVTAMLCYQQFPFEPQETAAPTLAVLAQEAQPGWPDDWRPQWRFKHEAVEVPGTHFTMMEQNAGSTASAIETWLSSVQPSLFRS